MASRLVSEYAEQMMSGRASTEIHNKARLLLNTYPELATTSIRIALIQAKYFDHEKSFRKWWNTGRAASSRANLSSQWRALSRELQSLNQRLNLEYEDEIAALQANSEDRGLDSPKIRQVEGQLLHTEYLIGWTSYFMGVLFPSERRAQMELADRHFRSFLQIESTQTLTEIAPEWFDFSSDWNTRALVGLGKCQRALNHPDQSRYCFELIGDHAVSQRTRDLRYVWELNSRVYLDEVSDALELAQAVESSASQRKLRQLTTSGRTAFALEVLNSSVSMKSRVPIVAEKMRNLGMLSLARQAKVNALREFVDQNSLKLDSPGFTTSWIKGLLSFGEFEAGDRLALVRAADSLNSAKAAASALTTQSDIDRCDFLLSKILFHEKKFDVAAEALLESSKRLEPSSRELSAEAQWLAIRSLSQLSQSNSRNLIKANRAIDSLLRRFPGSTYAKRAEFEKVRINIANLPVDQAVERLGRFNPNNSNYPLARHEIVRFKYQDWLDGSSNSEAREIAFKSLAQAENDYLSLDSTSAESRLKVRLLVIDVILRSLPTQSKSEAESRLAEVERRLAQAEQLVVSAGPLDMSVLQEFKYYTFWLASAKKDQEGATVAANWLAKNAKGSRFERSALIQLAQLADDELRSQEHPTQEQILETAQIYDRLSTLLLSSQGGGNSVNTRVALLRLAELKLQAGAIKEAVEVTQTLNRAFPNHKTILRQLAISFMASDQHAEAMPIWKKLILGVDSGSDFWFESKYNLALCLRKTGALDEAKELHSQTIRLSPHIPAKWEQPFAELASDLGIE